MNPLIVLFLLCGSASAANEKVLATLYYESLCPDSIDFIVKQLYPTWLKMSSYFDVEFIPYGNAKDHFDPKQKKIVTDCQHGKLECKGNMMAACAIDQPVTKEDQIVKFVVCLASTHKPDSVVEKCASISNLNFDALKACYNGTRGEELLLHYGSLTRSVRPQIKWVPTVSINHVLNITEQGLLTSNFPAGLCHHIRGPKPDICNDISVHYMI